MCSEEARAPLAECHYATRRRCASSSGWSSAASSQSQGDPLPGDNVDVHANQGTARARAQSAGGLHADASVCQFGWSAVEGITNYMPIMSGMSSAPPASISVVRHTHTRTHTFCVFICQSVCLSVFWYAPPTPPVSLLRTSYASPPFDVHSRFFLLLFCWKD